MLVQKALGSAHLVGGWLLIISQFCGCLSYVCASRLTVTLRLDLHLRLYESQDAFLWDLRTIIRLISLSFRADWVPDSAARHIVVAIVKLWWQESSLDGVWIRWWLVYQWLKRKLWVDRPPEVNFIFFLGHLRLLVDGFLLWDDPCALTVRWWPWLWY